MRPVAEAIHRIDMNAIKWRSNVGEQRKREQTLVLCGSKSWGQVIYMRLSSRLTLSVPDIF